MEGRIYELLSNRIRSLHLYLSECWWAYFRILHHLWYYGILILCGCMQRSKGIETDPPFIVQNRFLNRSKLVCRWKGKASAMLWKKRFINNFLFVTFAFKSKGSIAGSETGPMLHLIYMPSVFKKKRWLFIFLRRYLFTHQYLFCPLQINLH